MDKMTILEALNKAVIPRPKLNDMLSTVLGAQHANTKLDNVLIMGDSGAGKSHTLSALKALCKTPIAELNAKLINPKTTKSEIEEVIKELYINSKFDKTKTENGIILIDNIEQLTKLKAQTELIKLIRGTNYKLTGFEDSDLIVTINTKKILFVCTVGTDKSKELKKVSRRAKREIQSTEKQAAPAAFESSAANYKQKLTELGIVSELANLFAITITLSNSPETIKQLIPALTVEILAKYAKSGEFNARVVIDNKALAHIIHVALLMKSGVWGLKIIIHNMLQTVIKQLAAASSSDIVIISYNVVDNVYVTTNTLTVA
ncbi:MAG: AAA family ATPase [Candidatus Hodgkinia cicadicola]